jgi:galactonate dehydratase
MKVTDIQTHATWAGRRNWVFVKVVTDAGVHGWGEATLEAKERSVRASVQELGQLLLGEDPLAVEHNWQALYRRFWRGGVVPGTALAALDQALWDIRGKAWGVPVYRLLGGPTRKRIRLYTHVGMYDPAMIEEEASRDVANGFTAVKTGAWVGDSELPEAEWLASFAERVGRLREAVGPEVDLMVDNHGRSRPTVAVRLLEALEPHRPLWLEEPVPPEDVEGLARVRAASSRVELAAGERLYSKWDVLPLLQRRLVDIVQPDLCHAGGITECKKIAALAEAHHVDVAPHNPCGPVATAAAAHLAMAVPNFAILEFDRQEPHRQRLVQDGWTVRAGHLEVPDAPGLGVELDESAIAASPPRRLRLLPARAGDGSVVDV